MNRSNKGFTLIELLIVIGVLGILAAGLMAAVDPFEQLKKARDANNRNAVIELHNSFTRYYATHGALPWDDTAASAGCQALVTSFNRSGAQTAVNLEDADIAVCVEDLEEDGELKTGFISALGSGQAAKIFVASPGTTQAIVCFPPEGRGLWADASTKYSEDGIDVSGSGEACDPAGKPAQPDSPPSCYWCAR